MKSGKYRHEVGDINLGYPGHGKLRVIIIRNVIIETQLS